MSDNHFDVLIVGAGLSGIGAGYHLQTKCPNKTYAILESRDCIGGTWDLFRYPGVRSDSDMYTLGYSFRPWTELKSIVEGSSILKYVRDTASIYGIDKKILFGHGVKRASWSSADAQWTIDIEQRPSGETVRFTCNFLFLCSGYYKYADGYRPDFPGAASFAGRIAHPQKWTDDIDYAGKKVVVIGSGATAMTLVPEMAKTAAHVTMLQRSPTYVMARPDTDVVANWLRRCLPSKWAYAITRCKNLFLSIFFVWLASRKPEGVKTFILGRVRQALGPDYDVDTHFTPRYKPFEQRLCLVPNGDLFAAIRTGQASVVTDHIETFTHKGLKLASGAELDADIIVTATGLELQPFGGLEVSVDGRKIDFSKTMNYKGSMYSDVPNFASAIGTTSASWPWTMKCDLTSAYVCRLLNYMDRHGFRQCMPQNSDPSVTEQPWISFSAGYFQRSIAKIPKQGSKKPWRLYQNNVHDIVSLKFGWIKDGAMKFSDSRKTS